MHFLCDAGSSGITSLGWEAWTTICVFSCVIVALVRELTTPDLALGGGLAILLVTGVVDADRALLGFSNPAMLSVGALFVVAAAVRRSGALSFLERVMMPRSQRLVPALARIMLPASCFSGFLNNTPIVAFLTPLVQQWSRRAKIPASKLLMPLSFATILGGMGTLVGTSTNLLVSSLLAEPLGMFELLWVAVPAVLVGFLYFALIGHRLLPGKTGLDEEPASHRRSYQFDLLVPDGSPHVGSSVEDAGLRHLEDAFLAHISRRGQLVGPVSPQQAVEAGDVLTFYGSANVMDRLLEGEGFSRVVEAPATSSEGELGLPLFEAVVSPESSLVGRSLKAAEFRKRFDGVVLGIHRGGQQLTGPVGLSVVEAGDLLLIEARPRFEERWVHSGEFYLVAPVERDQPHDPRKAVWVLAILVTMMATVAFGLLTMVTAAIAAAIGVVLCGALSASEARRSIDLSVVIVIAAALGLGAALESTKLDALLAEWIRDFCSSGFGSFGALVVIYLATNLLTEFLTNSVSAVLVFPIGMRVAESMEMDPKGIAVAIAIAASASFATPIGYQTNLMVMGPGGYRFRDYLRVGLPLNLLVLAVALGVISWRWMP